MKPNLRSAGQQVWTLIRTLVHKMRRIRRCDVMNAAGLTEHGAKHHLAAMVDAGELELQGTGRGACYVPGPQFGRTDLGTLEKFEREEEARDSAPVAPPVPAPRAKAPVSRMSPAPKLAPVAEPRAAFRAEPRPQALPNTGPIDRSLLAAGWVLLFMNLALFLGTWGAFASGLVGAAAVAAVLVWLELSLTARQEVVHVAPPRKEGFDSWRTLGAVAGVGLACLFWTWWKPMPLTFGVVFVATGIVIRLRRLGAFRAEPSA